MENSNEVLLKIIKKEINKTKEKLEVLDQVEVKNKLKFYGLRLISILEEYEITQGIAKLTQKK